ncbi:unnamed protein product, partial [Polarella glacialis]
MFGMWHLLAQRSSKALASSGSSGLESVAALVDDTLPLGQEVVSLQKLLCQVACLVERIESLFPPATDGGGGGDDVWPLALCFERTSPAAVVALLSAFYLRVPYLPLAPA